MKTCKRCGVEKDVSCFNRDKSRRDGLHPYCTPCKTRPYRVKTDAEHAAARRAARERLERPCSKCKVVLPLDAFPRNKNNPDGHAYACRGCKGMSPQRQRPLRTPDESKSLRQRYHRDYYARTREKRCSTLSAKRRERKLLYVDYLGGECAECGTRPGSPWPIAAFDFHHVDPETKELNVSNFTKWRTWHPRVVAELAKCVVLCSNCRRAEHSPE